MTHIHVMHQSHESAGAWRSVMKLDWSNKQEDRKAQNKNPIAFQYSTRMPPKWAYVASVEFQDSNSNAKAAAVLIQTIVIDCYLCQQKKVSSTFNEEYILSTIII